MLGFKISDLKKTRVVLIRLLSYKIHWFELLILLFLKKIDDFMLLLLLLLLLLIMN